MPSISYDGYAAWSNHHLTIGTCGDGSAIPHMTVEDLGRVHTADIAGLPPLERFAATAATLFGHLERIAKRTAEAREDEDHPLQAPFAAGMVGCGWSFTSLVGTPVSQLICDGLASVGPLAPEARDPACRVPAERVALAGGGTRLREIVRWAEARGLSIATSGTHLGPTIAGGFGTASHGSRLGHGGLQNLVLGMHLVVGEDRHVWIERASAPVLSEQGLAQLAAGGTPVTLVRDDTEFENALVHLGGMGIVNGVAIELVPMVRYARLLRDRPVTGEMLRLLDDGRFRELAGMLGCRADPAFYELTLDPLAPFGPHALHTMYFASSASPDPAAPPPRLTAPDALAQFAKKIGTGAFRESLRETTKGLGTRPDPDPDPTVMGRMLRRMLDDAASGFDFYRLKGGFEPGTGDFDPDADGVRPASWGELHGDEITGGIPGALYNASFAIPRNLTSRAIPAIEAAVGDLAASFVFTLRFVSNPAGTLAFTRFEENMVLEIDGVSPLICRMTAARLSSDEPDYAALLQALEVLGATLETGALCVRDALDRAGIPYSMHWAKLGKLDRAKVEADFGTASSGEDSLIAQWRGTRDRLLTPFGRRIFWNPALVAYGVLDRPEFDT